MANDFNDDWQDEEAYWRSNFSSRPYAQGSEYDKVSGGYRYGYEAANRNQGRSWNDVESDLEKDWNNYQHRGETTWQHVKDAVQDAWERVTGRKQTHSSV